jgi:cytochrome b pre-mRNA-processing protein 3
LSFLSRIFGRSHIFGGRDDGRTHVRPLWHRIVALAREPEWYARCGIADTVAGRFDAITLVLALVLLRMEREAALIEPSVRLTEIFVEDMDGQLRESGVGDLVVGKHIGRLMSVLGGRLGALREALAPSDANMREAALTDVVARNVTLVEGGDPAKVAQQVMALDRRLAAMSAEAVLAARFEP